MLPDWFEMKDARKRRLSDQVWVPLHTQEKILKDGKVGYPGFREEFFGLGSLAVPEEKRNDAKNFGWDEIGIAHRQTVLVEEARSDELLSSINRFRAIESGGIYVLAKDLMRLIADRIDTAALQKIVPPPSKERWGSLKSLEKFLAKLSSEEAARAAMERLFGAYELRVADAHFSSQDLTSSFKLSGVDPGAAPLRQGHQLIVGVVTALLTVGDIVFHNKNSNAKSE